MVQFDDDCIARSLEKTMHDSKKEILSLRDEDAINLLSMFDAVRISH